MKSIYRHGLGHRYGRAINHCGIHYNFSLPDEFWRFLQYHDKKTAIPLQDYKTEKYLALIRNLKSILVITDLFGATPVVCKFRGQSIS